MFSDSSLDGLNVQSLSHFVELLLPAMVPEVYEYLFCSVMKLRMWYELVCLIG